MQLALAELLILAGLSCLLGPWILLRRLTFYSHAAATVTFPGLVLAAALAVPALPLALACAGAYALLVAVTGSRSDRDGSTALLLVAALAVGAILASDVAASGAGVDRLLFGTLVAIAPADLMASAAALAAAALAHAARGRAWLARGFDPAAAGSLGAASPRHDVVLLGAIALAVVASLAAVGALLASVLLVVPAATARLLRDDLTGLRVACGLLALVEGLAALLTARYLDVPVGPVLAVIAGAVFALASVATTVARARVRPA